MNCSFYCNSSKFDRHGPNFMLYTVYSILSLCLCSILWEFFSMQLASLWPHHILLVDWAGASGLRLFPLSSASGFTWSSGQWCHSEWPPSSCLSGSLGQESNPCLRNIQHVSRCKLTSYSWELFHCLTKPQWLFLRLPGVSQGFGHRFLRTSSVILVGACLLCRATILNVLQVPSRLF